MTAEFAIVLPSVVVVLALIIGGLIIAATKLSLVTAAYDLARLEARGDAHLAAQRLAAAPSGTTSRSEHDGNLTCVTLTAHPGVGILQHVTVSARGCAVRHTLDGPP